MIGVEWRVDRVARVVDGDTVHLLRSRPIELDGPLRVVCYESGGWDRLMGDLINANGNSASQWLMTEGNGGAGWPPYTGAKA